VQHSVVLEAGELNVRANLERLWGHATLDVLDERLADLVELQDGYEIADHLAFLERIVVLFRLLDREVLEKSLGI